MHTSPNISRTTVIGYESKYELTKKRSSGRVSGGVIIVFKISDSRDRNRTVDD